VCLKSWKKAVAVGFRGDNHSRIPGFESSPNEPHEVIEQRLIIRIKAHLVAGDLYVLLKRSDSGIASDAAGGCCV
jgi:hypothetical protein